MIFSTFVTILGSTRDWKSIDLKFYLFIVSYCLYSKARLLFLEANIKNVIFYPSDDGIAIGYGSVIQLLNNWGLGPVSRKSR